MDYRWHCKSIFSYLPSLNCKSIERFNWKCCVHNRDMAIFNANINVLVFENNSDLVNLVKMALEPDEPNLFRVKSIQEGLEKIKSVSPDIIVIDLNQQSKEPDKLCSKIRQATLIPILVLSPFDSPKLVASTLNAGADDYLTKPIQLQELKVRMENLLKRSQPKPFPVSVN